MPLEADIRFAKAYARAPTRLLRFSARLERRFNVARAKKNRREYFFTTVFSVICFNLATAAVLGAHLPYRGRESAYFVEAMACIAAPVLAGAAAYKRFPRAFLAIDVILFLSNLCATLGVTLLNNELPPPPAIYSAFSLMLLPIALNILSPAGFATAVAASTFSLLTFVANSLLRADFPIDAKIYLTICYVFVSLGSLIARYRVERAERINFLRLWRDNLRSGDIERANRRLDMLSRTDGLTGLANRREFDSRLTAEAERARAARLPLALIVLDIDHFKAYNDRLGHPQGDKCIRAVAQALAQAIGDTPPFAGRIGGEEFAAVLPGASVETAAATAQKIRQAVEAMQLPHPALGERRVVSVSLGVAVLNPARFETPEALMARADAALYRAKGAGRDRAEVDLRAVGAQTSVASSLMVGVSHG